MIQQAQFQQLDLFARAVEPMAAMARKPLLYGPDGRALAPTVNHTFRREAAKGVFGAPPMLEDSRRPYYLACQVIHPPCG